MGCHLVLSSILQISKQLSDSVAHTVWFGKSKVSLKFYISNKLIVQVSNSTATFKEIDGLTPLITNLSISLILSLPCWKTTAWKFAYNITSSYSACPYLRNWILEHRATILQKGLHTANSLDSWEQGENKYQVLKRLEIDGTERGQGDRPLRNL